ncbi:acyl-CoA carboxylase subunit epsilon [Actinomadura rugatobispora]|uniref:Acyl-CoA carboxylase subunit epsilon n=1 Tax=Actinomadura rugatobispora TaxID=1994 RepID=A0ABW1AA36_9ACTN|nr:hypothetical protein GCM10010200_092260 [Actinomadura rugatobispora]
MTEQMDLRIVRGTAGDEEIAALVVALTVVRARTAAGPAARVVRRAGWSTDRHWSRTAWHACPGMWAPEDGHPIVEHRPALAAGGRLR